MTHTSSKMMVHALPNVMHAPIIAYDSMLISYSLVKAKPFGKCQHSLFRRFKKIDSKIIQ